MIPTVFGTALNFDGKFVEHGHPIWNLVTIGSRHVILIDSEKINNNEKKDNVRWYNDMGELLWTIQPIPSAPQFAGDTWIAIKNRNGNLRVYDQHSNLEVDLETGKWIEGT